MVISFSGPQSSGKTTLLNILKEKNPEINFVPEVTRLIKKKYKAKINEEGNDKTQTLIMYEHIINLIRSQDHDVNIFDRCLLDGLIYTVYLYYEQKSISDEVMRDVLDVYSNYISSYNVIFYTEPEDVPLVDDGERSADDKFRKNITELFELAISDMKKTLSTRVVRLKGTIEERLAQIQQTLANKNIKITI